MLNQFALAILLLTTSPVEGLSEQLSGRLVQVAGYQLKPAELPKEARYVVFYYTASWCPNCHAIEEAMIEMKSAFKKADADIRFVWVSLDYSAAEAARYYAKSAYRGLAIKPGIKHDKIIGAKDALEAGIPSLRIYEVSSELWEPAATIPSTDINAQLKLLQEAIRAP
ncbi:thioredoxin-like domain-containing protein [Rubellicoccus peritrichatus]|uniref:Thioredoxin-like domain-containing protein n=1 Tax=Rubellicoccus peritrichatus TaxID=3080537 RepID=A0AAQ3QW33_9BACT|nr:thioredoxin-like domain-containing protein [Puniceicoccus sp. CR14]WOO42228.1 thioredoxin-like domain-containing protein [Puniceicoccus sp. CR14]